MSTKRISTLYVGAVFAGAVGAFVYLSPNLAVQLDYAANEPVRVGLIALFVLLGELVPIKVRHGTDEEEVTSSTMFAFALLLIAGPGIAILASAIACVWADLTQRKPLAKLVFNSGQFALSLSAAAYILHAFDIRRLGEGQFQLESMGIILLAAIAFFIVNHVLVTGIIAISTKSSFVNTAKDNLLFQSATAAALLALSPVVVAVNEFSAAMVPLLLVPMAAVHKAAHQSALNEYQALHDGLTGLPNRTLFHERVGRAIHEGETTGTRTAVLMIDLDRFKEINDTLGHHSGDVLLIEVARTLRDILRPEDTVARLGGDEFAIVLPAVNSAEDARHVAERIERALDSPITVEGLSLTVRPSTGIAIYPDHGHDIDALVRKADVAMYTAKEAGKGNRIYSETMHSDGLARLSLAGDLRSAIGNGELQAHYQPKLDLNTGEISGVEALIRWDHPSKGMVSPMEFIPIAEQTGMINDITFWMLSTTLQQLAVWRKEGFPIALSVNVSMRDLLNPRIPSEIARLLIQHRIPPSVLELELTESSAMSDPVLATNTLENVASLGVKLSIDDYGTGHSSLSRISSLPVDIMKIDRSFVMEMDVDQAKRSIVKSTIMLAKNLGLRTVAEGVENEAIQGDLIQMGCDYAQGFHIAKPLPAPELTAFLTRQATSRSSTENVERFGNLLGPPGDGISATGLV